MRDDFEFNIEFCAEIEKYRSLYDFKRSDYCNRSVQDKAWQTIAKKFNETVSDCKERWKNIRGRYSKYKKKIVQPSGSGVKPTREYYLAPYLQFLDNFLKSRPPKGNIKEKRMVNSKEKPNDEEDDEEHELLGEYALPQSPLSTPSPLPPARKNVFEAPDPDMAFLQSLLPDMKAMNDQQKRKFKIETLNLAENILEQSASTHSSWTSGCYSSDCNCDKHC